MSTPRSIFVQTSVRGDVNADGLIDIFDLSLAKRGVVSGFSDLLAQRAADVTADGSTDLVDLIALTKYLHGQLPAFPGTAEQDAPEQPAQW